MVLTGIADLEEVTSFMRQGISNYLLKLVESRQ